MGTNIPV